MDRSIKIKRNRSEYIPCLVNPKVFEGLWIKNHLYVKEWKGEPNRNWFSYNKYNRKEIDAFITPEISIETLKDQYHLYFVNGRYRSRWLIQNYPQSIPVGIYEKQIELALSIGLLIKEVSTGDELKIA